MERCGYELFTRRIIKRRNYPGMGQRHRCPVAVIPFRQKAPYNAEITMLLKKYILMAGIMFLSAMMAQSSAATEIAKVTGEVKVRRGLDEKWQNAFAGMMLKNIDTILSLEGEVVLRMDDGTTFHLGSHSILDIGDLRRITRQEMFLYLMAQKVDKIQPRGEKARLHVGNVSVVHF